jgi:deazaflavin-dependent oxidoreductase (nitroreductase family)
MWYNPLIRWLLRSPLHSLISKNFMLITYTGRKSGKVYSTPVNYVRDGDHLLVTSYRHRTWWRNLRGGAPVTVRVQGQERRATGEAITTDQEVIANLMAYLRQAPQLAKYFQVTLDANGEPNIEEAVRSAQDRVMVRIRME